MLEKPLLRKFFLVSTHLFHIFSNSIPYRFSNQLLHTATKDGFSIFQRMRAPIQKHLFSSFLYNFQIVFRLSFLALVLLLGLDADGPEGVVALVDQVLRFCQRSQRALFSLCVRLESIEVRRTRQPDFTRIEHDLLTYVKAFGGQVGDTQALQVGLRHPRQEFQILKGFNQIETNSLEGCQKLLQDKKLVTTSSWFI